MSFPKVLEIFRKIKNKDPVAAIEAAQGLYYAHPPSTKEMPMIKISNRRLRNKTLVFMNVPFVFNKLGIAEIKTAHSEACKRILQRPGFVLLDAGKTNLKKLVEGETPREEVKKVVEVVEVVAEVEEIVKETKKEFAKKPRKKSSSKKRKSKK